MLAAFNAVAWLPESLTDFLAHVHLAAARPNLQHDFRLDAYRHVQVLELAWFEHRASGRLLTILNDDVNQLERFLDLGAEHIILTAVTSSPSAPSSS